MKLPVYQTSTSAAPADNIRQIARQLFPRQDVRVSEHGARVLAESKSGSLHVDVAKGGLWASDDSRLWRIDPESRARPSLLKAAETRAAGTGLLKKHGILPQLSGAFRFAKPRVASTVTKIGDANAKLLRTVQNDTNLLLDVEVDVGEYGLPAKTLPVVGGGGRFGVTFGERGSVLGLRGVWRPVVGKPVMRELRPERRCDEIYRSMTQKLRVEKFSSELAYYAAPSFTGQSQLYPVRVYSGVADIGGRKVPLRKVIVPAVEGVVAHERQPPAPTRRKTMKPFVRPLPADLVLKPGSQLPPGIVIDRRRLAQRGIKFGDVFKGGTIGKPLQIKPGIPPVLIKELGNLLGFYSAGTSWIGESGGLSGSRKNARGFVDELDAAGWTIRFNWGDAAAWESDWNANDDDWVDAVDFVFYTGHANSDGWMLATPNDTFLDRSEVGGPLDKWGRKNLEWMVIAACGPLQDSVVGSGGDALQRWRDAFDGLHMLMGYAQVTYDNEEEGKRLASYARGGATIMQSWFRAAQEIQGSGIWAGAYYLGDSRGSTGNDHLWGKGSVGPDVLNPTWRACTWVPC